MYQPFCGMLLTLSIEGEHPVNPEISLALYRLIQEGLTNSVRHGKANHVEISIYFMDQQLEVTLKDNGKGCKQIHKGNGIMGMEERLAQLGGSIQLKAIDAGFNLNDYVHSLLRELSP